MDVLQIIGYFAALLIGVSLGLIGGGGSILTMPILVYLMDVEAGEYAPAYSLLIVGSTALVGGLQKFRDGFVDIKTFVVFGIPSILAVYLTRTILVPAIPETMHVGAFDLTKRLLVMGVFAILMVGASVSMIRGRKESETAADEHSYNYPLILLEGLVVGMLAGLVGAGGGFLIIPALVKLSKLSMKKAIGTSLFIIAATSLFGFSASVSHLQHINWSLLAVVSVLAIGGIFLGHALSKKVSGQGLKVGFGWFVLVMGVYILSKELML
ncbi:TSUP family transporter [bacterium]|nr:TSUP family transporter [bacterium]